MSIWDLLLDPGMLPFAIALGIVFGLLLLELLLLQLGLSLIGDGAEVDADFDPGLDAGIDIDPATEFDLDPDILSELDAAELDAAAETPVTPGAGGSDHALSWLGLGKVPFSIWLAGTLTAFGISGYLIQLVAVTVAGTQLPAMIAAPLALLPGIALGARFARAIGGIMPKSESSAISRRSFGNRRGVITVGTARRGHPAQARFTDGHGNMHYAQVEPLKDDDTLGQGTEIAILRLRDGTLRAIRLDTDAKAS